MLVLLTVCFYVAVNQPAVQTWIAQKLAAKLTEETGAKVDISYVEIKFFTRISINDLYIEDQQQDTLLYLHRADANIGLFRPLKNSIHLKDVSLVSPTVHIKRTAADSTFNFQFIVDYLASSEEDPDAKPLDISFSEISIDDLDFEMDDQVGKEKFVVNLAQLTLSADEVDLINEQVVLNNLILDEANISIIDYKPPHKKEKKTDAGENVASAPSPPNQFDVSLENLMLTNSSFRYVRTEYPKDPRGMDFNDIWVKDINLDVTNLSLEEDSLFAHINNLSANEQSGFNLTQLSTDFKMGPDILEFDKLKLITPHSEIQDYFVLKFNSFKDFGNFNDLIYMDGTFDAASIAVSDIDYFAKALGAVDHNKILLTGRIRGNVSNLKGRNLKAQFGTQSSLVGNVSFRGLPQIKNTFMSFTVSEVLTSLPELKLFYPGLKYPKEATKMGNMKFSGHFDGFVYDFVADGTLTSELGSITSDANVKIDSITRLARYNGNLAANKFKVGEWLGEDEIGAISFDANINGRGLEPKEMKAKMKGYISSFSARGYQYQNINVDGTVEDGLFEGEMIINDDNLLADFNGTVNFQDSLPVFNFTSFIKMAKLDSLQITNDNITLRSHLNLNFVGNQIDNITGDLDITNTLIMKDEELYKVDSIFFDATDNNGFKTITLNSDIANGTVKGQFSFQDMPNAVKNFLQHYFERADGAPVNKINTSYTQAFDFNIKLNNTRNLTELLDDKLQNIEGGWVNGNFNVSTNSYKLNGNIPGITYDNASLLDISVESGTLTDEIYLHLDADSLLYRGKYLTERLHLNANLKEDNAKFHFSIQDSMDANNLDLKGKLKTDFNFVELGIAESSFKLLNQKWDILPGNSLYLDSTRFDVNDLIITKGTNKVSVETTVSDQGNRYLDIYLDNILLGEILPAFEALTEVKMEGTVNGKVSVANLMKKPAMFASLAVDSLTVSDRLWGQVTTNSYFAEGDSTVHINASLVDKGIGNNVNVMGTYNVYKKENYIDLEANLYKLQVGIFEEFISSLLSEMSGEATGKINLSGSIEKPIASGKVNLTNAGTKVNYLNTDYQFDKAEVVLSDGLISIAPITLRDEFDSTAVLSGSLSHNYFRDFAADLNISTNHFQFLKTNETSPESFYGTVYAGGTVRIKGPFDKLLINNSVTTRKGTEFFISVNQTKDVNQYSFYQFVDKKAEALKKVKEAEAKKKRADLTLDFDLTVTPDAQLSLIMSYEEGDVIEVNGNGNLNVKYERSDLSVVGDFVVEEGQYDFTMQQIITKKFVIDKGSQILWTGDPYDARLAIDAFYKLRAAPYDLVEDELRNDEAIKDAKNRLPVYLYLVLRGSLLDPSINFDIEVPDADAAVKSALESKLQLIKLDQNEMNKQVVGLLVLNRFLPINAAGGGNTNIASSVNNTLSEFLSNQLSLYLSDWISEFITEVELDINYRSYQNEVDGGTETDIQNRQELQLALTKSFMNDRIEVDVGGNFDFGEANNTSTDQNSQTNIAGEFEVRYAITEDGRIKLKIFRKGEYDIFQERNTNKQGFGIAYKRDFDNFADFIDFLRSRRKRRQEKEKNSNTESTKAATNGHKEDEVTTSSQGQ